METEEFAARRRAQFVEVDKELGPFAQRAMTMYANGRATWSDELLDAAEVIWREVFETEAPNADPERYVNRFRESVGKALSNTTRPEGPPTQGQIDRVTMWLGTYTVNDATWSGVGARGGRFKKWVTMHDSAVRESHRPVDGQIVPIGATFNVGAFDLRFPGDPVGPPELWINCRCVIQPAARVGEASMSPTTFAIEDDENVIEEGPVTGPDDLDDEMPPDEPEEDEELITEIPVHGTLAPEGVATGDGRMFADGGLSNRDLPLPIAYQLQSGEGHSNSVTVGRIDEIFREGNLMQFRGALMLNRDASAEVIDGIIDGTVRGISVDVDDVEVDMEAVAYESEVDTGKAPMTVFKTARIAGVTIVPIPAFQEAFIALGHEWPEESEDELSPEEALAACGCKGPEDDENPDIELGYDAVAASAFAPGTKDGPGWITHPVPTARIRRYWVHGKGAAKIRWGLGAPGGDFNRCRRQLAKYVQNPKWLAGLCANMHKEATGFWPGSKVNRAALMASGEPAPIFNLVASASYVFDSNAFKRQEMAEPRVGVEVEGDHVYGYIAQWGVCHIGIQGVCTTAPHSLSDYWYFATGKVDTEEGTVRVGQITMDTGHASMRANAKVAAAHYDNTGAAAADVAVGEDEFGIWFSGVLRSKVTDEQRHALRAAGRVSGDWRQIGHDLELVAALAVNVPGFPIPHVRAGVYNGEQVSLVAAGLFDDPDEAIKTVIEKDQFSATEVVGIIRSTVAEYRHQEKRAVQAAPIRQALRQKKIESLRSKIKE
jgi:hypothetical protein